jgi:hypothetical protein
MEPKPRHHVLLLIAAAAVMIYLYGHVHYTVEPFRSMDLYYYRRMAQASPGLAGDIPLPFAYRLLGPWIAGLLPGSDPAGFLAITIIVSLLIPVLLYRFLVEFGIERSSAFVAALLFVFNKHLFGSSTWNFFQVKDSIGLICIAGCFIAMLRGNWPLFSLALLAGALSGEAPLIMAPVLLAYLVERRRPGSEWRWAILSLLPGIAGFFLLRLLVPAHGGTGLVESFLYYSKKLRYALVWVGLFANPFVPLVLLPLIHTRDAWDFVVKNRYLAVCFVLVFFSTLFGSNNERLMAPGFIAVYAFIGIVAEKYWRGRPRVLLVIVAACFLASGHYLLARYPLLPGRATTRAIAAFTTIAVTAASYLSSRSQVGRGLGRNAAP